MSTNSPTIPPDVAAHVLFHYGREGGYQAGSFTTDLLAAMGKADPTNLDRLALGFPAYVAAVTAIQYDPNGVAHLQRIAAGEAAAGEPPAPQCPEALINPEYPGGLLRCVAPPGGHDVHQTPGGTEWRVPVDSSTEVPF
ncbi:hypothetical protein [Streptomyces mirabilis]|uniref:hypothetical protein n=1 Tax=Streptomyces mirabilis TaxID=68239 RepID=UPI0036CCC1A0